MHSMDLSKLKLFYVIAQEGNMTRAAERLNLTQSALSKSLSDFEARIQTRLFKRLPSGMQLTVQGERLFAHTKKLMAQQEAFEKVFYEKEDHIEGELRILTTPYIGTEWLLPHMANFLPRHPHLTLQVLLNNERIATLRDADIAIGPFMAHQPDLIQQLLFTLSVRLYASPAYLKKFGTPQTPEDLDHHRLIIYKENYQIPYANWILNVGRQNHQPPRKPYIQVDLLHGMVISAVQGLGIIESPNLSCIEKLGLVEILPDISVHHVPYYFIYSASRRKSKKIITLFHYLSKKGK